SFSASAIVGIFEPKSSSTVTITAWAVSIVSNSDDPPVALAPGATGGVALTPDPTTPSCRRDPPIRNTATITASANPASASTHLARDQPGFLALRLFDIDHPGPNYLLVLLLSNPAISGCF